MTGVGAGVITALVLVALWGQWRAFGTIVAIQLPVIAFNVWFNEWLLPRRGPKAELLRVTVNLVAVVGANFAAHWILPVWLWLPFVALAFDHFDRLVSRARRDVSSPTSSPCSASRPRRRASPFASSTRPRSRSRSRAIRRVCARSS